MSDSKSPQLVSTVVWTSSDFSHFRRDLEAARRNVGLTQTEAAARADTTQPYWSAIESGKTQTTERLGFLVRLIEAVGGSLHIIWPHQDKKM